MCLNGTYPFLSATLVRQLPYYLFRETCFMDSYPTVQILSARGSTFFSLMIYYGIFHFTLLTFSLTRLGQIFFCKKYRRKYTCHRPNSVCYLKGDKNFLNFSETSSRQPNLCYNIKSSCRIRLSVGHQLPKLNRRVRLPYPACRNPRNIQHAWNIPGILLSRSFYYFLYISAVPLM